MFLEKAQAAAGEGESSNWRLFPQDFRDKNETSCYHHDQVKFRSNRGVACSIRSSMPYIFCPVSGEGQAYGPDPAEHMFG